MDEAHRRKRAADATRYQANKATRIAELQSLHHLHDQVLSLQAHTNVLLAANKELRQHALALSSNNQLLEAQAAYFGQIE